MYVLEFLIYFGCLTRTFSRYNEYNIYFCVVITWKVSSFSMFRIVLTRCCSWTYFSALAVWRLNPFCAGGFILLKESCSSLLLPHACSKGGATIARILIILQVFGCLSHYLSEFIWQHPVYLNLHIKLNWIWIVPICYNKPQRSEIFPRTDLLLCFPGSISLLTRRSLHAGCLFLQGSIIPATRSDT